MKLKLLVPIISFLLIVTILGGCLGGYISENVNRVYLNPDGNYLISDDGNSIQFWNISSGKELLLENHNGGVYRWSPKDDYLANNGQIRYFSTMKLVANYSGSIFDWSYNGKYFISIDTSQVNSSNIYIYESTNYSLIKNFSIDDMVRSIVISPDGNEIIYYSYSSYYSPHMYLKVVDIASENVSLLFDFVIPNECDNPEAFIFNPIFSWSQNINSIGIGGLYDYQCLLIYIIDSINGSIIYKKNITSSKYNNAIAFSPNNERFIVCGPKVEIWNVSNGEKIKVISDENCVSIDWSLNGKKIVTGGLEGIIKVYDAQTGELLSSMKTKEYQTPGFEMFIILFAIALILFYKKIYNC